MMVDGVTYGLLWWIMTLSHLGLPIVYALIAWHLAKTIRIFVESRKDNGKIQEIDAR